MSYPTMPRPTDNQGDNHRAAIATLETARQHNGTRQTEVRQHIEELGRTAAKAKAELATLEDQAVALQRGIDALKAAHQ